MKNGILVDGQERSSGHLNGIVKGITKHDFVADTSLQITDEGMFKRLGNLGNERNVVRGYNKVHARSALAYTQINALAITVLPKISAGAIFQVKRYNGRFHGEIHPTTPTGERST